MKHLRGEGNVPEALLGAVVAFHLSGKPNRVIEALTGVSNSQVSTIIERFNNKEPLGGKNSTGRLKKMTRRPLQALIDNVEDEPFKSIKSQQNAVNAIGYNFYWKSVKKYINEAGFFLRIPVTRLTLIARHVDKGLAWTKERVRKTISRIKTCMATPKDFRVSGITRKLHDSILTNKAETIAVILESSGPEAGIPHIIDDTYKQLKSSSDFLKYIITKYKMGSLRTLKKIQIPCISVVESCLTLCLTTVHDFAKWDFVEARSCTIPTTSADKKQWIKVFELLAFLKHIVEKSLSDIDQLEDESLGYVELGSEEILVKDYFNK